MCTILPLYHYVNSTNPNIRNDHSPILCLILGCKEQSVFLHSSFPQFLITHNQIQIYMSTDITTVWCVVKCAAPWDHYHTFDGIIIHDTYVIQGVAQSCLTESQSIQHNYCILKIIYRDGQQGLDNPVWDTLYVYVDNSQQKPVYC